MSYLCCTGCRLRFSPLAAAFLTTCPECGAPPTSAERSQSLIGFRLLDPGDLPRTLDEAIAVSLPVPLLDGVRGHDLDS
ncbi:MAG: hypothetical protein ACR2NR_15275 [Solirubrobacteraceae bacterium]